MLVILFAVLASTLRLATPLIFSSLGGVFSERSGVVNIALEGIMINGAFFSIFAMRYTTNPWLGVIFGMIVGMLTASLLAILAINLKGNQVIAGVAINLLAASLTAFVLEVVWHRSGQTDPVPLDQSLTGNPFPFLEGLPVIGESFFAGLTVFVYLAFFAVAVSYYVLYKTPFGLRIRAVGEHPKAADTVGINVYFMRYVCVIISGALAGLGGASLALGSVSSFREGMISGKGFIALAAMIFGKWHPVGALAACLFFGFAEAVQIQAASLGLGFIPSELLQSLPYVATILALAGVVGRAVGPKASGQPYEKGHR